MSWLTRHERAALYAGLLVRLLLLATVVPAIYQTWFLPFLIHSADVWVTDPWTSFLAKGGSALAFPYGPLYIAAYGPLTWIGSTIDPRLAAFGLGLTVLLFDAALYGVLRQLAPVGHRATVTLGYWLSPIVIYVCYWHGQLDVFPAVLLTSSLLMVQRGRGLQAGLFLGLATSAKLSMGLAVPFIWIYATTRRLRSMGRPVIAGTLFGVATLLAYGSSSGFRRMVLDTPEKEKVFALAIDYGPGLQFYVMPLAFAALLVVAWRVRRFNFDVLFNLVGIGFFVLFLLTPASPGWAMWLMPFLVMHLTRSNRTGWVLVWLFSALFTLFHLVTSSGPRIPGVELFELPHVRNLLLSAYLAAGGAITYQMVHRGIIANPFFRASRQPLVLGIAGDSGAGKDTLAVALGDLFGAQSTAMVSGDDYHLWDRHKPMWRALTHLNPRANDLRAFTRDALALAGGRAVQAPHYDHHVGRMTKPQVTEPSDVVIVSGLHALVPPELKELYDLRIYLAMDEGLRRFFKLRRDVLVRGHAPDAVLASLVKRDGDSRRYIQPQADAADLIMALVPIDPAQVAEPLRGNGTVRMGLAIETTGSEDLSNLIRVLVSTAGVNVVHERSAEGHPRLLIDGDPSAGDIAAAAATVARDMFDFLALSPTWAGGHTGIMQLVVVDRLAERIYTNRKARR